MRLETGFVCDVCAPIVIGLFGDEPVPFVTVGGDGGGAFSTAFSAAFDIGGSGGTVRGFRDVCDPDTVASIPDPPVLLGGAFSRAFSAAFDIGSL